MTESKETLLQCYNKGCGKMYEESQNHAEACVFHPGGPVFHDAYKGWSCCQKKCTDFTEFLNIKGCTKSSHSNVKPPEPEKPKVDNSKKDEVITYDHPPPIRKPVVTAARPDSNLPLKPLQVTVSPSLTQMLEKLKLDAATTNVNQVEASSPTSIAVGTLCKNGGCGKSYEGPSSATEACTYHSGAPVFHEGLKFWTCCQKRTTDFDNFLNQEGCTTGTHIWLKKQASTKSVSCRHDWHQTGNYVCVSIYAKGADPAQSTFEANPVKLNMTITFNEGTLFESELLLYGTIDVEKSSVTMSATKVEVKMKKAEPMSWSKLSLPQEPPSVTVQPTSEAEDSRVEVNLDDLELFESEVNLDDLELFES